MRCARIRSASTSTVSTGRASSIPEKAHEFLAPSLAASARSRLRRSSACSSETPPPNIRYDSASFTPAVIAAAPPKPVDIVQVPEPLPLPGQLKPPPSAQAKPEAASPTARVDAANQAALQEPTSDGYINAIQIYPFSEGALYHLYTAPEEVSDIALQPGEKLVCHLRRRHGALGRRQYHERRRRQQQVHILVKPFAAGLKTNLVITTDRRIYHLDLESTDKTYMAAVSWTYPEDQLFALKQQNAAGRSRGAGRYRCRARQSAFPLRDHRRQSALAAAARLRRRPKVYIEFPERIDQGEAPPLFVVGANGGNELVNYRVRGNYYIVDQLFAAAELRLGENPQQVVRISRTDAVQTSDAGNGRAGFAEYPR